jgi:uncharacterized protein (DUF1330 family)
LVGSSEASWALAFEAHCPSPQAFGEMVKSEHYLSVVRHRTAAADSRLIVCSDLLAGNSVAPFRRLSPA